MQAFDASQYRHEARELARTIVDIAGSKDAAVVTIAVLEEILEQAEPSTAATIRTWLDRLKTRTATLTVH